MGRPNRIWWWKQKGEFAVDIAGKRHRLGSERDKAERRMHELLSKEPEERVDPQAAVAVMDVFLEEATFKSGATREWYRRHLQAFTDWLKAQGLKALRVADLAPHHVNKWIKSRKAWSDGTKNGACRAVQRAFRWANQMGYIKVNPVAYIPDKPPPGKRENVITPEGYREIVALVKDECFRDLLTVSWECGCRPQESLRVERRHVNEGLRRWEFPAGEGKKTKKKVVRYVYLTDNALAITMRLMVKHPDGAAFPKPPGSSMDSFFGQLSVRAAQGKARQKDRLVRFSPFLHRTVAAGGRGLGKHRGSSGTRGSVYAREGLRTSARQPANVARRVEEGGGLKLKVFQPGKPCFPGGLPWLNFALVKILPNLHFRATNRPTAKTVTAQPPVSHLAIDKRRAD